MSSTQQLLPPPTELKRTSSYLDRFLYDPDLPTPAAVIDIAAARQNCQRMLNACKGLDLSLRAEVKSHKCCSLARLQCGMAGPVRITVSTLREAEELGKSMRDAAAAEGREVDVMYGQPVGRGDVKTLASLASARPAQGCQPGGVTPLTVSVLVDDPEQLRYLGSFKEASGGLVPNVHIKLNAGSNRAGVWHYSDRFEQVADAALEAHARGDIVLSGLYAHTSHAMYKAQGDREENLCEAMFYLARQFCFMMSAVGTILRRAEDRVVALGQKPLVLSASVRCVEVLEVLKDVADGKTGDEDNSSLLQNEAAGLLWTLKSIRGSGFMTPEVHAGGYAVMDLQQLVVSQGLSTSTSWSDLAITILAEVRSVYPGQGEDGKSTEALINTGALALGKERSEESFGWGVVTRWGRERDDDAHIPVGDQESSSQTSKADRDMILGDLEGWIVERMSQEHGILTWRPGKKRSGMQPDELKVGQRVRIWPNRSSIASSHFGWYLVVDSDREGKEDEIVDIWDCAEGW